MDYIVNDLIVEDKLLPVESGKTVRDRTQRRGAVVWVFAVLSCVVTGAHATDYTWSGASRGSWNSAANWRTSGYPRLAGDTALFTQDFTNAYSITLAATVAIDALRVTDTVTATAVNMTLNTGLGAPTFTFNGATPVILADLASGKWLTVNPAVNLNTANATFSKRGAANVYISNPGANFFVNLNPTNGLNVSSGTLELGNISSGQPPLALKTGTGTLQLDLTDGSTFFADQSDMGGTGTRVIKNVRTAADASSNPQTLVNSSADRFELWIDPASTAAFFAGLNGVSAVGPVVLNNFTGAVSLTGKSFACDVKLCLSGNGGAAVAAVLSGGSFTGNGSLVLGEGVTLNVDDQTGLFDIGGDLIVTSLHTSSPYSGGDATVNWNASGKTIRNRLMLAEQGGTHATFNMLGGTLTPDIDMIIGNCSHSYDHSEPVLNVSGGTLVVTNGMFRLSRIGAEGGNTTRSTVTVSSVGVLRLSPKYGINVGERAAVHATLATVADATINLDGGTLALGQPFSRRNVVATSVPGSSATVQFYFNGGTLRAEANLAQVFSNFDTANSDDDGVFVKAGGAVIDCNGCNIGIANNLLDASGGAGGGLAKYGAGVLTLSGTNTYCGDTAVNAPEGVSGTGLLKLGASEVIPHGTGKGNLLLNAGATVDLNGFSETVNGLSSSAANALVTNSSATASVLCVGENAASSRYAGGIGGKISLIKTGAGTWTLAAPCSYTGATEVADGALALESACTLRSKTVSVRRGASLSLAAADVFGGAGSQTKLFVGKEVGRLGAQGRIIIPAGVEVNVLLFAVDGWFKKAGTWGATGSGATFVDDSVFAGQGILRVSETGRNHGTVVAIGP